MRLLGFLCPLIYFASYLTRKNYSVVMAEIIISEGISNSQASLAATLSLISYGAGQIISGILGDKFKPQNIILCGLASTALMNAAMPLAESFSLRAAIWFINGFAQSMLWPPLVKIMAASMDKKSYDNCCVNVNIAGISGTILLYLSSSAIWIKYFSWKYVFYSSAAVCALITLIWLFGFSKLRRLQTHSEKESEAAASAGQRGKRLSGRALLSSGFIFIAIGIIAQGALRDGITDWVPSFIISTFNMESSSAILKSVILPVFGVLSIKAVGIVNGKIVRDELKGSAVTFTAAALGCALLFLLYAKNQYVTLFAAAAITGLMHAVNFFLVCVVPARFEKYGIVSTMSGVINSLTYVGSAAATYGFGAIAGNFGWSAAVISWFITAALGAVCCFAAIKPWRRFIRE